MARINFPDGASVEIADEVPTRPRQTAGQAIGVGGQYLKESFGEVLAGLGKQFGIAPIERVGRTIASNASFDAYLNRPSISSVADIGKTGDALGDVGELARSAVFSNLPTLGALFLTRGVGRKLAPRVSVSQRTGGVAGLIAGDLPLQYAEGVGELRDAGVQGAEGKALAAAIPRTLLDIIPTELLFSRFGAGLSPSRLRRTLGAAGTQVLAEGITESAQEGIGALTRSIYDPTYRLDSAEVRDRLINAAALGGIAGGAYGGVGGFTSPSPPQAAEPATTALATQPPVTPDIPPLSPEFLAADIGQQLSLDFNVPDQPKQTRSRFVNEQNQPLSAKMQRQVRAAQRQGTGPGVGPLGGQLAFPLAQQDTDITVGEYADPATLKKKSAEFKSSPLQTSFDFNTAEASFAAEVTPETVDMVEAQEPDAQLDLFTQEGTAEAVEMPGVRDPGAPLVSQIRYGGAKRQPVPLDDYLSGARFATQAKPAARPLSPEQYQMEVSRAREEARTNPNSIFNNSEPVTQAAQLQKGDLIFAPTDPFGRVLQVKKAGKASVVARDARGNLVNIDSKSIPQVRRAVAGLTGKDISGGVAAFDVRGPAGPTKIESVDGALALSQLNRQQALPAPAAERIRGLIAPLAQDVGRQNVERARVASIKNDLRSFYTNSVPVNEAADLKPNGVVFFRDDPSITPLYVQEVKPNGVELRDPSSGNTTFMVPNDRLSLLNVRTDASIDELRLSSDNMKLRVVEISKLIENMRATGQVKEGKEILSALQKEAEAAARAVRGLDKLIQIREAQEFDLSVQELDASIAADTQPFVEDQDADGYPGGLIRGQRGEVIPIPEPATAQPFEPVDELTQPDYIYLSPDEAEYSRLRRDVTTGRRTAALSKQATSIKPIVFGWIGLNKRELRAVRAKYLSAMFKKKFYLIQRDVNLDTKEVKATYLVNDGGQLVRVTSKKSFRQYTTESGEVQNVIEVYDSKEAAEKAMAEQQKLKPLNKRSGSEYKVVSARTESDDFFRYAYLIEQLDHEFNYRTREEQRARMNVLPVNDPLYKQLKDKDDAFLKTAIERFVRAKAGASPNAERFEGLRNLGRQYSQRWQELVDRRAELMKQLEPTFKAPGVGMLVREQAVKENLDRIDSELAALEIIGAYQTEEIEFERQAKNTEELTKLLQVADMAAVILKDRASNGQLQMPFDDAQTLVLMQTEAARRPVHNKHLMPLVQVVREYRRIASLPLEQLTGNKGTSLEGVIRAKYANKLKELYQQAQEITQYLKVTVPDADTMRLLREIGASNSVIQRAQKLLSDRTKQIGYLKITPDIGKREKLLARVPNPLFRQHEELKKRMSAPEPVVKQIEPLLQGDALAQTIANKQELALYDWARKQSAEAISDAFAQTVKPQLGARIDMGQLIRSVMGMDIARLEKLNKLNGPAMNAVARKYVAGSKAGMNKAQQDVVGRQLRKYIELELLYRKISDTAKKSTETERLKTLALVKDNSPEAQAARKAAGYSIEREALLKQRLGQDVYARIQQLTDKQLAIMEQQTNATLLAEFLPQRKTVAPTKKELAIVRNIRQALQLELSRKQVEAKGEAIRESVERPTFSNTELRAYENERTVRGANDEDFRRNIVGRPSPTLQDWIRTYNSVAVEYATGKDINGEVTKLTQKAHDIALKRAVDAQLELALRRNRPQLETEAVAIDEAAKADFAERSGKAATQRYEERQKTPQKTLYDDLYAQYGMSAQESRDPGMPASVVTVAQMQAEYARILGKDFKLLLPPSLGGTQFGHADTLRKISVVALDATAAGGSPMSNLYHEAYHQVRDNLLDKYEARVMENAFAPGKRMHKEVEALLRSLNKTAAAEHMKDNGPEAEAYAYQYWKSGQLQPKGIIERIFRKISAVFERFGNFLRGQGFQNWEDVFNAIDAGEMANRQMSYTPAQAAEGLQFSLDSGSAVMQPTADISGFVANMQPEPFAEIMQHKGDPATFLRNAGRTYKATLGSMHNAARTSRGVQKIYDLLNQLQAYGMRIVDDAGEILHPWTRAPQEQIKRVGRLLFEADQANERARIRLALQNNKPTGYEEDALRRRGYSEAEVNLFKRARLAIDTVLAKQGEVLAQYFEEQGFPNQAEGERAKAARLAQEMYLPRYRYGKHTIYVRDRTNPELRLAYMAYNKEGEATSVANQLREFFKTLPNGSNLVIERRTEEKDRLIQPDLDMMQFISMLDTLNITISPEVKRDLINKLAKTAESARTLQQRKDVPGESQEIVRVLHDFSVQAGHQIANVAFSRKINDTFYKHEWGGEGVDEIRNKEIAAAAINVARSRAEDQNSAWTRELRKAAVYSFLGGNISGMLLNFTQIPLATIPLMSAYTSYTKAASMTFGAFKDTADTMFENLTSMKRAAGGNNGMGNLSADEVKALYAFALAGGTQAQHAYAMAGIANGQLFSKSKLFRDVAETWMRPWTYAEQLNRRSTFIAAYRLGKEIQKAGLPLTEQVSGGTQSRIADMIANRESELGRPLTPDEIADISTVRNFATPQEFAAFMVDETQFNYNKFNQSPLARTDLGSLLYTFKSFPLFFTEMLASMPAKSRNIALTTLFMFSGLAGLPFADDLDDIMDTVGQRFDIPVLVNTRKSQEEALDALGKMLGVADLGSYAMHGILDPVLGVGLSKRLGLGDIIPATDIGTYRSDFGKAAEGLAGPIGSMLAGGAESAGSLLRGDVDAAIRQLPVAGLRNPYVGAQEFRSGEIRTIAGQRIGPITGFEAMRRMVGITPQKSLEFSRFQEQVDISDSYVTAARKQILKDRVDAVRRGDQVAVRQSREYLDAWNTARAGHPELQIVIRDQDVRRAIKQAEMSPGERALTKLTKPQRAGFEEQALALDDAELGL